MTNPKKMPRIKSVEAKPPSGVLVRWVGGGEDVIELAGWIGKDNDILAPLRDPVVFLSAHVGEYGSAVQWGDGDGDLGIDALHLQLIAAEQRPFGRDELVQWQKAVGLSNREAAALMNVALSTWNLYRAGAKVPTAIGMLCRAMLRDPILMHAHLRPRAPAGRPATRFRTGLRA